jgi:hypothetical protein
MSYCKAGSGAPWSHQYDEALNATTGRPLPNVSGVVAEVKA